MSPQLVADFTTQFAAMSALNKLVSCGLGHQQVVVKVNASVGRAAAGAATTTSVIPQIAEQSLQGDRSHSDTGAYPSPVPCPAQFGLAQITVALDDTLSAEEVQSILELAGAHSIRRIDETFMREDARVWPAERQGNRDEVLRAIEASRAGESLHSPAPK